MTPTMMAKSKIIRDGLELIPFHPDWCVPSLMSKNPLAWRVEVDGLIVNARHMPPEFQQKAYEAGLIPGIPAASGSHKPAAGEGDQIIAKIGPASE